MDNFLIAKATDVGIARQVNEDSMTVFDSPNGQVMAVCDGMGGQAAGDVASQMAVSIIESILTDNTFDTPEEAIRRSVLAANQGVLNRTMQNPELEGMGSTCVMLIIKNGRVHCGWVGDSRIYYIANHTIRQISHDQSYVQQLVDSGQITQAEAANHPQKNEIVNCIGLQGMTAPDTVAVPIVPEPGSVFLLCSDGLSGMIDDRQIERVVSNESMTLQQKADRLIALANEAGGLDNITVELVQFGASSATGATSGTLFESSAQTDISKKKSRKTLYSVIGILIFTALCFGGGYFYYTHKNDEKVAEEQTDKKQGETKQLSGEEKKEEFPKKDHLKKSEKNIEIHKTSPNKTSQKKEWRKVVQKENSVAEAAKKAKEKADAEAAKKAKEKADAEAAEAAKKALQKDMDEK